MSGQILKCYKSQATGLVDLVEIGMVVPELQMNKYVKFWLA